MDDLRVYCFLDIASAFWFCLSDCEKDRFDSHSPVFFLSSLLGMRPPSHRKRGDNPDDLFMLAKQAV